MFLSLRSFAVPQRCGIFLLAAAAFAAGLTGGVMFVPAGNGGSAKAPQVPAPASPAMTARTITNTGYPAEVLRVLDGDTFEARVRLWPGMDVTTRVRLRGIDAPEMHARCDDERTKAISAREALTRILAEGRVGITHVGQDKYGGRVDADASTAQTPDISAALLSAGHARFYSGGRRESWCMAAR